MSQPAAAVAVDAADDDEPTPYTHELQQRLMQSHADLAALADARSRGDDAAAAEIVKRLQPELTSLAVAADRANKRQQQQQQQAAAAANGEA